MGFDCIVKYSFLEAFLVFANNLLILIKKANLVNRLPFIRKND